MQFSINHKPLKSWLGKTLIFGIFETDIKAQLERIEFIVNSELLFEKIKSKKFNGEKGQKLNIEFVNKSIELISFIGLGSKNTFEKEDLRNGLSNSIRSISDQDKNIGILLPSEIVDQEIIFLAAQSIRLAIFKDNRFNSKRNDSQVLKEIEFLDINNLANISFKETEDICAGVELARKLVKAPPNSLTPAEMAKIANKISSEQDLSITILERKDCEKLGMGAYLAVSKGSDLDPKFIHLTYKSSKPIKRKIALVGKGLTFDSGGYNLKVGASQIEMMKYDMGGSAAVLGSARAIGALKPNGLEIHFIVAACENMINGSAIHPGDVVTASNGKTIEINNTDAEGRLTLADALTYASNLKPDSIIDLATLTGACVVALGNDVAGLWSNNDNLTKDLLNAAKESGEGLWHMPLQKSYKDGLKSHIADMKNTGPRAGGSITAALFLEEFFDKKINWAHIDIAGTCWTEKDKGVNPSGATGFGVKTLVKLIKDFEKDLS